MKTYYLTIFSIFILITNNLNAIDIVADDIEWYYRDVDSMYARGEIHQVSPCQCPCDSIIKSGKIRYSGQNEDDVYLYGGFWMDENPYYPCQQITLNIKACQNTAINTFGIDFDFDDSDCFNSNFNIYYENSQGNKVFCSTFNPKTQTGQFCQNNEPVSACSTRKKVFYICGANIHDCEHKDIDVYIKVDSCPDKKMTFHFDYLLTAEKVQNDRHQDYHFLLKNEKNIQEILNQNSVFSYSIINIFNSEIKSGYGKSFEIVYNNALKEVLISGFYIIKIFQNGNLLFNKKIARIN